MSVSTGRTRRLEGICENCDAPNKELRISLGGIKLCDTCYDDEQAAITRSKAAVKIIETARHTDNAIELSSDICNAATVSFAELQAAILHDSGIPESRKDYALMDEIAARIEKLDAAIFAEQAEVDRKKNERYAFLKNAPTIVARLQESERAKYKKYDVNYKPAQVSKPRPTAVPSVKFNADAVMEASKKYGVSSATIRMMSKKRGITPEQAAKELSEMGIK